MTTFTTEDREDAERNLIHANAPVAWIYERPNGSAKLTFVREPMAGTVVKEFPLYTHPVKDLEDIDINITWNENSMRDFGKDELNFARAILRKAQEK